METINNYIWPILWVVLAYCIGSFPTGVLYSRSRHNIDVRSLGSGGSGATNVGRNFGFRAAIVVTAVDVLKGLIPVLIAKNIFSNYPIIIMLTGLACVIGHAYPVWAGFRGGKIVATSVGVLVAFNIWIALIMVSLLGILIFLTSTVSLSSMTSYSIIALYIAFTNPEPIYKVGFILIALLLIYRHRTNIERIIKHEESRINWGLNKPKK
ncbi:glycerol-3-phosphate 1-O-acyltransferase PlsY [Aerococcaceae bacterium DSM 111021]|nr:glycerol-3-phosphate 1-O-acyltransferase PlsY [Aerococcaceae bacterium DSM 111021]